jgi:Rha family phage regulatory protein
VCCLINCIFIIFYFVYLSSGCEYISFLLTDIKLGVNGLLKVIKLNHILPVNKTFILSLRDIFQQDITSPSGVSNLRAIKKLDCSQEFNERNFTLVEYVDAKGEKRPMYQMTKDGFVFLVMGFTGSKAAKFKEDYINAFNEMYEYINSEQKQLYKEYVDALDQFEKFSELASQAGKTLNLVGKKLKPKALVRVNELEKSMQYNLFLE